MRRKETELKQKQSHNSCLSQSRLNRDALYKIYNGQILLEFTNPLYMLKAWFSYVGKIPDDRGFCFLPTIPDFADISDSRQKSVPDSRETPCFFVIGGLEPSNLGDW